LAAHASEHLVSAPRSIVPLPCLCANLRRAARAVTQVYDRALRPVGLRATQLTLLQALERGEGITPSRLGVQLAIDATTLSRTLRPLQRRGWIASASATDRRKRQLHLTPAGRRQLARAQKEWKRIQVRLRKRLGRGEWGRMMVVLERVTAAVLDGGPDPRYHSRRRKP
jgi:DNA-binding MarR family transcriptional regulator